MDFALISRAVAPILISLLSNTTGAFKTDEPPVDKRFVGPKASRALADLQAVLNAVLALDPPLEVDGWLGPKTEAAINQAIEKLKSLGVA